MGARPASPGRNGLVAVAGAAAALMLLAVAIALLFPGTPGTDPSNLPTDGITTGEGFPCDPNEAAQMTPFLDGVVQLATDRIARLDLSGAPIWSVALTTAAPVGIPSGGRLLVHDPGGFTIAVFDAAGLVWSAETEGHIDGATISASGHVAALTDVSGYKGVVSVFDPAGSLLFQWMSSETGYVLSAAVDPAGTRLDVSVLHTDGSKARPVFRSFAMDGSDIAQRKLEPGSALPLVVHDERGRTLLCGEDAVVAFQLDQKAVGIAYRLDRDGIRTLLPSSKGPVWFRTSDTGEGCVAARLHNGTEGPAFALPSLLSAVAVHGDLGAAATGPSVSVFDLSKGVLILRKTFEADVLALGFPDAGHLLVVTRASVQRIALP